MRDTSSESSDRNLPMRTAVETVKQWSNCERSESVRRKEKREREREKKRIRKC